MPVLREVFEMHAAGRTRVSEKVVHKARSA
jgi:hypothetical protein